MALQGLRSAITLPALLVSLNVETTLLDNAVYVAQIALLCHIFRVGDEVRLFRSPLDHFPVILGTPHVALEDVVLQMMGQQAA